MVQEMLCWCCKGSFSLTEQCILHLQAGPK